MCERLQKLCSFKVLPGKSPGFDLEKLIWNVLEWQAVMLMCIFVSHQHQRQQQLAGAVAALHADDAVPAG